MAVINPHTTRAIGTVLTAAIYNADHQNHITNALNLNAELSLIAGVGTASGVIVSNGAGVISGRTITGTLNQLTVADGNGLAANPTLSLPADFRLPGTLFVTTGTVQTKDGLILVPVNQDYVMHLKMPHAGKINETVSKCSSGTCTATFKINGVAVDGLANAVSAAEQTVAHVAANDFVAGDDLTITVSANAACLNFSYQIKYTRIGAQ